MKYPTTQWREGVILIHPTSELMDISSSWIWTMRSKMKLLEHIMHAILCVLLLMKTFSMLNRVGTVKSYRGHRQ